MRLRRLAIQAAKGSPIGRPNASTPAVARLKPRRQDPRDAQRTFPRLPGPNPRTSACGRALGTSGSFGGPLAPPGGRCRSGMAIRRKPRRRGCLCCGDSRRAPRPSQRIAAYSAVPQQRLRSIRHAVKLRRRSIASGAGAAWPNISPLGAAAAPPIDSPRREGAPQGCRQRRRRCRAKHQPARRRIACLRQCPACGARDRQRRRCGACRLREAAAAGRRATGAGLAAARGARGLEEAPPSAPGMRVAAAWRGAAALDWLRVGRSAFIPGGHARSAAAGGIRRRRLGPEGAPWSVGGALAFLGRDWPKTGPEGWRAGAGKARRPCLVENFKDRWRLGRLRPILLPPPPARRSCVRDSAAWALGRRLGWASAPAPRMRVDTGGRRLWKSFLARSRKSYRADMLIGAIAA